MKYGGLLVLFMCFFLEIPRNEVEGSPILSPQEHLALVKELKILNKPTIKSIKTDHGSIFDCVDFYKQPAFDHPMLKNHSFHFQMKPQFPNEKIEKNSPQEMHPFRLKGVGCPMGTVPIRRITKEDLMREKFASANANTLTTADLGGTYKAIAYTNDGLYTGAIGIPSIYKQNVLLTQYSASRIKIQNENEMIEFGFRVDPTIYGNKEIHFYIKTDTSAGPCFDTRCGFIVTNRNLSPGLPIADNSISIPGKVVYEVKIRVQRDNEGNWWLSVLNTNQPVGFWPSKLFTKLAYNANYIDWGGEVNSPDNVPVPPMGSGIKPMDIGNLKTNAYFRWIAAIDTSGIDFNPATATNTTEPQAIFYDVIDIENDDPVFGHTIYFGGHTIPY